MPEGVLVAVTDHAAERYRQRVGTRTGALDVKPEVAGRVARAWQAGRVTEEGADVQVRDGALLFRCRLDRRSRELVVVTVWEEGDDARVPRRFTDALREPRRPRGEGSG